MKHVLLCAMLAMGCVAAPPTTPTIQTPENTPLPDPAVTKPEGVPAHFSWRAHSATLDKTSWPASVPRDYVLTPHGFLHPECVHELADGQYTTRDSALGVTLVHNADGSVAAENGACTHPGFDKYGAARLATTSGAGYQPNLSSNGNGYIIAIQQSDFSYPYNHDFGNLGTTFYVPTAPPGSGSGVQFFMWNGISGSHDIFQPIISYNNSSSFVVQTTKYQSGSGYYGTAYSLSGGDIVRMSVGRSTSTSHGEFLYKWNGSSWAYLGSTYYGDTDSNYPAGVYAAVETYFMTTCQQYPGPVPYSLYQWSTTEAFRDMIGCWGLGCTQTTPGWYDSSSYAYNEYSCTTALTKVNSTAWDWSWTN
jgi:hypothetical protein